MRKSGATGRALIFASGCLFGFALLMKQPGLLFIIFGSAYLFSRDWRAQLNGREIVSRNLLFVSGAVAPLLVACVALWKAGVFEKFWFWTIHYAREYGGLISLSRGARIFSEAAPRAIGSSWVLWVIAAVGLTTCFWDKKVRSQAVFLGGLLGASGLAALFYSSSASCLVAGGGGISCCCRHLVHRRPQPLLSWANVLRPLSRMANVGRSRLFLRAAAGGSQPNGQWNKSVSRIGQDWRIHPRTIDSIGYDRSAGF